ncbi:hypothetical protein TorRG33x02_153910, partial [Trema orientale]
WTLEEKYMQVEIGNGKMRNTNISINISSVFQSKELWIVAVAGRGQDVVSDDVANGAPSQDIDDVEPNRVVGLEQAHVLASSLVSSLVVGHSVLLGQTLFGHVFSLEVEEHESAQEEGQPCAQAYHQRWVQLCFDAARLDASSTPLAQADGFGLWECSKALE